MQPGAVGAQQCLCCAGRVLDLGSSWGGPDKKCVALATSQMESLALTCTFCFLPDSDLTITEASSSDSRGDRVDLCAHVDEGFLRRRGGGGRKTGRGRGKRGIQSIEVERGSRFTKIHRIHLPLPAQTQKPISRFTKMWN